MADVFELTKRRKDSPNGAGHYHVAEVYPYRVRALIDGTVVALSDQVVILKEVGSSVYHPVFYFPPGDVERSLFQLENGYSTDCPIKGAASYWRYLGPPQRIERTAWSYEAPLDYSHMIAGHLGFDQRRVTLEIAPREQA
jgi:uncharacterized protein (DUF427 family)